MLEVKRLNECETLALLLENKLDQISRETILNRITADNDLAATYALSRILLGLSIAPEYSRIRKLFLKK